MKSLLRRLVSNRAKDLIRYTLRGGVASGWNCLRSPRINHLLARLSATSSTADFEIHILTSRDRLTMALWMVASWIATTGRCWRFVIHDDGSLRNIDAGLLQGLLPGCRVLLSSETTPLVKEATRNYPLCWKCRNLHPLGRKLIDMPLLASGDKLLSIDTDILFFQRAQRILDWTRHDNGRCIFMEDVQDACLVSAGQVQKLFGARLVEKVNTGIIAVPREALTLDLLETCLARAGLLAGDPWYIEQTLYAIAGSMWGQVELLPTPYVMSLVKACPPNAVARHYVGSVRHLFYSEGVPRVSELLRGAARQGKQLAAQSTDHPEATGA